jgi:hypothetical protein
MLLPLSTLPHLSLHYRSSFLHLRNQLLPKTYRIQNDPASLFHLSQSSLVSVLQALTMDAPNLKEWEKQHRYRQVFCQKCDEQHRYRQVLCQQCKSLFSTSKALKDLTSPQGRKVDFKRYFIPKATFTCTLCVLIKNVVNEDDRREGGGPFFELAQMYPNIRMKWR